MTHKNTVIIPFYLGTAPDGEGRMLAGILAQDDHWLERTHNYVQWLFPLPEPSRWNPYAPLVNDGTVQAFKTTQELRDNLTAAYVRMLAFYGLKRAPDGTVGRAPNWPARKHWFTRDGHNSLRLTRIIKCLALLGLEDDAYALQRALANLCVTEPDCGITATTRGHWHDALPEG